MSRTGILYTVGPAPHWRTRFSIARTNWTAVLALLPTALVGAGGHAFGSRAAELEAGVGPMNRVILVLAREMGVEAGTLWFIGIMGTLTLAMGLGVLLEYLAQLVMRQPYRALDGHGALMGALMGLMLPPDVPLWILVLGVAIAIVLGKQIFGGLGGYPMHPVLVGWLILLLSWPNYLYPVGAASMASPNLWAVWATLAGGMFLWWRGSIRPQIPLAVLASVMLFSWIFEPQFSAGLADPIFTGHVMLGAFFVATDSTCSPANRRAMWIYGGGIGFLIVLIRVYGIWPDSVPFAIMLMNILSPLLDRIKPKLREIH